MVRAPWPIIILTLRDDQARRAPLLSWLDRAGLRYQLHYGIDARQGLPAQYEAMIDREAAALGLGRAISDGECACALGHRAICQTVLDQGLDGAVVLEDDARPRPEFADFVRAATPDLPPLVLLDYAFGRAIRWRRRQVGGGTMHFVATQCSMADAYFVTRSGAARIVTASTPVRGPADWPVSLYRLGAGMMVPRLVTHEPPATRRDSHLDAGRDHARAQQGRKPKNKAPWLRRKLSVRVGRAKGER